MTVDPLEIIREYYVPGTRLYDIFMEHGELVVKKSIEVAGRVPHLVPDMRFIEEAAMLHDIGIFMTDSRAIHCRGRPRIFVTVFWGGGFWRNLAAIATGLSASAIPVLELQRTILLPIPFRFH